MAACQPVSYSTEKVLFSIFQVPSWCLDGSTRCNSAGGLNPVSGQDKKFATSIAHEDVKLLRVPSDGATYAGWKLARFVPDKKNFQRRKTEQATSGDQRSVEDKAYEAVIRIKRLKVKVINFKTGFRTGFWTSSNRINSLIGFLMIQFWKLTSNGSGLFSASKSFFFQKKRFKWFFSKSNFQLRCCLSRNKLLKGLSEILMVGRKSC